MEFEATDDINKDIFIVEFELGAALDDGNEKVETIEIEAGSGAFGVAEIGGRDEGLDFNENGTSAFEGGENDGAVGVLAFGEEGGGGVFDFGETATSHFKDGSFAGGSETIFDGAEDFEAAVTIAFETQYNVDEMFENFGAGERAFFGDVADDDDGGVGDFGGADDEVATVGDLRDPAGGRSDFGDSESLDGIDDYEIKLAGFDGFGDVISGSRASEFKIVRIGAQANCAELDLSGRFLSGQFL